jgi:topoisomerase IA-like protein
LVLHLAGLVYGEHVPETAATVWRQNLDVRVGRNWAYVKDRFLDAKLPDLISLAITSTISALIVLLGSRLRRWHKWHKRKKAAKRRAERQSKDQPTPAPNSEAPPPSQT